MSSKIDQFSVYHRSYLVRSKIDVSPRKPLTCAHPVKPGGTFYIMPDFSHYEKDSIKLANFLLEKAKVVTVPGVEFGMEGHIRLSICGSLKDITDGVARIRWALDPESPEEIFIGDKLVRRDW